MNHTCPFCASSELAITTDRNSIVERVLYWVRCVTCDARGPSKPDRTDAIACWNQNLIRRKQAVLGEDIES